MNFPNLILKSEYRSKIDNIVAEFYSPLLENSILYQRASGFFSSTALVILSDGIYNLTQNGGKMQLITSPRLSEKDIAAITEGVKRIGEFDRQTLLKNWNKLNGDSNSNLLKNLIIAGILEIKIAFLESNNEIGMFHEKFGLMYDAANNVVAFAGSMNESENSFVTNYESIDVFASWTSDNNRVQNKQEIFKAMWADAETGLIVRDSSEISHELLKKYLRRNKILTTFKTFNFAKNPRKILRKTEYIGHEKEPFIPKKIQLRPYQIDAIKNWATQNYCGIFDMATGTGKTWTALAAIVNLYNVMNKNLAAIIVCPYQHLVEQWAAEVSEFGMQSIICYSYSNQRDWKERLQNSVNAFNFGRKNFFCIIATNATFSTDYVQGLVKKLRGNIVLVVDEAHNFGAAKLSKTLLPNIPYRIALSATIDRIGEGTKKLYSYFGKKCIEYTLSAAINNGMLTPYFYYPIVVSLDKEELNRYLEITAKINKASNFNKFSDDETSEYVQMLLIKRARLVAGANEKISKLRDAMQDFLEDNQILIYCGATTMHDVDYNEDKPPIEEARQIDIVTEMLGNDLNMRVTKFTAAEKPEEREQIKKNFAEGNLQALVAIRCLDEGINIPSVRTAFILASSTNAREYIQRRGRVLRNFQGKNYAKIYDFITLPTPINEIYNYSDDQIKNFKSLAVREIIRIKDFAEIAENPFESDKLISEIQRAYDINFAKEGENLDFS